MAERRFRVPGHLFRGRVRTSTIVLIVAFVAVLWLQETYEPPPEPPPATQFVPPGFVPDPRYTWVPRTNVRPPTETSYPTTTTTTTTTPTPTTTSPTETTPTTTEPGPLVPQIEPTPTTPETPGSPAPFAPFAPAGPPVTTTAPPS